MLEAIGAGHEPDGTMIGEERWHEVAWKSDPSVARTAHDHLPGLASPDRVLRGVKES